MSTMETTETTFLAAEGQCTYSVYFPEGFIAVSVDLYLGELCISSLPGHVLAEEPEPFASFFNSDKPLCDAHCSSMGRLQVRAHFRDARGPKMQVMTKGRSACTFCRGRIDLPDEKRVVVVCGREAWDKACVFDAIVAVLQVPSILHPLTRCYH